MYSDSAIVIQNVSKYYKMYDRPQDRLLQSLWRGRRQFYREFWALKDVSFEIPKGRTIGIIGKNGSGKSTILQILARTLQPSEGSIQVNGRVAALLELGSGFNPDFTGRENVILNGTIMGLSKKEIENRLPLIEKFADIGEFIDQPVKTYSSGMFVRLAFACAVNVDPDILIIDEALAVGDLQFQLKCIDKMKSFKKEGKTILFVSHDLYTVRNFCDEAIWMMNGKIHLRGDVQTVTDEYNDYMKIELENTEKPEISTLEVQKNDVLTIDKVTFFNENGEQQRFFNFNEPVLVTIDYTLKDSVEGLVGGVALFDKQNTYICGLNTKLDKQMLPSNPGKYQLKLSYDDLRLLPGTYHIDVGFFESTAVVRLDYKTKAGSFVINSNDYLAEGITHIKHEWVCQA